MAHGVVNVEEEAKIETRNDAARQARFCGGQLLFLERQGGFF